MKFGAALLALTLPAQANADWITLRGDQIGAHLVGRVLQYEEARQDFRASGKTLYTIDGRDSWGNWRVAADRYCSQWPPSDVWRCYTVQRQGAQLRFVGDHDDITEATYAD